MGQSMQAQNDPALTGLGPVLLRSYTDGENDENRSQAKVVSVAELETQYIDWDVQQRDRSSYSDAPSVFSLHERSASESNRLKNIRLVPYMPPRPEADRLSDSRPEALQSVQRPQEQVPTSPSSSLRRRRRQYLRRRRSKDWNSNERHSVSSDSDRASTTIQSRGNSRPNSRPNSWASRGSWSPSNVLAWAGALPLASSSATSPPPGSPSHKASSSSGTITGDAKTSQSRAEGLAVRSVLSEKSGNVLLGGGKRARVAQTEIDLELDKKGYTDDIEGGSVVQAPIESVLTSAKSGSKGNSGAKLAASSTIDTSSTIAAAACDSTTDATPSLLVPSQHQSQFQHRQQQPLTLQNPYDIYEPELADAVSLKISRAKLSLTPATASFTAAAASYVARHRNSSGMPQLPLPASPSYSAAFSSSLTSLSTQYLSSSYQHPPLSVTTSNTALSTLSAPTLSPSSSVASLASLASSQAVPRPNSRRRNLITIHSDKTFSLVPRGGRTGGSPRSHLRTNRPPSDLDSSTSQGRRSPPLSYISTTICSSSSHEQLSSDVFSSDSRPSSPLTISYNALDRSSLSPSISPPSFSIPKSANEQADLASSAEPATLACNNSDTAAPVQSPASNYQLASGLRKVPKTPELEHKGKERPISSSSSLYSENFHSIVSEEHETDFFVPSDLPHSYTSSFAGRSATESDTHDAVSHHHRKTSIASDQSSAALPTGTALSFTASIISANTNYEVYAHSSSPPGAASTPAGLESTETFYLLPSSSQSDNVEILGVSSPAASPLPALHRTNDPNQTFASLASYPSIASFDTGFSESSAPNVVILGASSPPAPFRYLDRPRSDEEDSFALNADMPSSPPLPPRSNTATTGTIDSNDSEPNYVLHGEPSFMSLPPQSSSSNASSLVTSSKQPRPAFSQESLVVLPLKTVRTRRSNDKLSYYKSRSRESLRHAASIKSLASSFGQEASSIFFAGQALLNINTPSIPIFTGQSATSKVQTQLLALSTQAESSSAQWKSLPLPAPTVRHENYVLYDQTPDRNTNYAPSDVQDSPLSTQSTSPPRSPSLPQQPRQYKQATIQIVEDYPHQWSSQLSTVMSETDGDSLYYPALSRSASIASDAPNGSFIRDDDSRLSASRSSSSHSHNKSSIRRLSSPHLGDLCERHSRRETIFIDRPSPAYHRTASAPVAAFSNATSISLPGRTIRDHDEDGDGLADLKDIGRQPSRSGIAGLFPYNNGFTRNLHSSGSMRSVASGTFPSWARVYYGSGEHRPLSAVPSLSDLGQNDDCVSARSRPNSAFRRSPTVGGMFETVFNSRCRPNEVQEATMRPLSDAAAMEAGQDSVAQDYRRRAPGLRRITSSVWSPHLQIDRRATRFSIWDPPSATWTINAKSTFDLRNSQIICFTVGFILPFVWMIAAFLPLPVKPKHDVEHCAEGDFGVSAILKQRIAQSDEMRYQSTRWWRTLNRVMSVFGLLVIGAIIALAVVGVHQGW